MKSSKKSSLKKLLREILESQVQKKILEEDPHQLRDIVSWEDWVPDEYYSGAFAKDLWPFWSLQGKEYLDSEAPECVITGSLGGGKSTFGLSLIDYQAYVHTCYRFPNRLYGLGDVSPLVYAYLSSTAGVAADTGFRDLVKYIDSSPYFREECKRKDLKTVIDFTERSNVLIMPGTGRGAGGSVISRNLFLALLDEANFYKKSSASAMGDLQVTRQTYVALMDRRRTRFASDVDYKDDSKCILISSTDHDKSFTEERINEARRLGEKQHVIVVNPWTARPEKYSKERFFVFIGNENKSPEIVESTTQAMFIFSEDKENFQNLTKLQKKNPDDLKSFIKNMPFELMILFLEVPVTFLPDFRRDIESALKNIGGKSIKSKDHLFRNPPAWTAAVLRGAQAGLKHPFVQLTPCVSEENGVSLRDLFIPEILFDSETGRFRRHPEALRYIHVDSSLTQCPTGIVMSHQSGCRIDEITNLLTPEVELDFLLEIQAPTSDGDEVSLEEILKFILWLHVEKGVKFGKITYDMFASPMQLQVFRRYNLVAERLSIDSNYGFVKDFVRAFTARNLVMYEYIPLKTSLFNVVDDREKGKILRPPKIFKDILDAAVGAHHNCLEGARVYDDGGSKKVAERSFVRSAYRRGGVNRELAVETAGWVINGATGVDRKLSKEDEERIADGVRIVDSSGRTFGGKSG